jgi:ribosomal protein S18 acetylase RimI-like enzyme
MAGDTPSCTIELYTGDRAGLAALFRLADDSERAIAAYRERGDVLVARDGAGATVGHVQMIGAELKSLAVVEPWRGVGLGRALVRAGIAHARERGESRIVVSTAAADTRLLRFYQQLGFRLTHIERDVFTPLAGYPADLRVDGIRILDRVWAALEAAS